jgi:hypothetical protein
MDRDDLYERIAAALRAEVAERWKPTEPGMAKKPLPKFQATQSLDIDFNVLENSIDAATRAFQHIAQIKVFDSSGKLITTTVGTPATMNPPIAISSGVTEGSRVMSERPLASVTERFFRELEREVYGSIGDTIRKHDKDITAKLALIDQTLRTKSYTLEVHTPDTIGTITGARHCQLDQLIMVSAQRLPVMLVGMAGSGKTHAAAQVADAFDLKFYAMSVGAQTSKSDIIGFVHAGGEYVRTLFREAYEHGGVFLMDEIDAGNANVLIMVNAALSNDYCAFPDQMVKRHKDFVFIASANTFGNGANRQYVGRNQLDAATLDRFALIEWLIDDELEKVLAGDSIDGQGWFAAVKRVRRKVESEGMRVLVTPRATQRGAKLIAAGVPLDKAADIALFNLFPADKRRWARDVAKLGRGSEPTGYSSYEDDEQPF